MTCDETADKPPIFILGNRRSGTTMLRLMLTCHRDIVIPPEAGFMVLLGWKYDHGHVLSQHTAQNFIKDLFEVDGVKDWELGKDTLLHHLSEMVPCTFPQLVDAVYREYIEQKFPGKKRWGDKTTGVLMVEYLDQVDRYFPTAQYIHIIRDPRAVGASYKRVPHLSNDMSRVALEWRLNVAKISRFGDEIGPGRYHEVKYEALVESPESELDHICEFLDEPFDRNMLDFASKNRQLKLEPERHMGWKKLTLSNVTTSRVAKWHNELTQKELRVFQAVVGAMINELGYEYTEEELPLDSCLGVPVELLIFRLNKAIRRKLRPWKYRLSSAWQRSFANGWTKTEKANHEL